MTERARSALIHAGRAELGGPERRYPVAMAKTDANPPMPEFSTSYVLQEVDPTWLTSAVKPKQFLHIDQAECILCEGCVDICPWKCIHMLSTNAIDEAVNADQPGDDPKDHVVLRRRRRRLHPLRPVRRPLPHRRHHLGQGHRRLGATATPTSAPTDTATPTASASDGACDPSPIRSDPARSRSGAIRGRRASNAATAHLVVVLGGVTIAETNDAVPRARDEPPAELLLPAGRRARRARSRPAKGASFCEFKGRASYWTVRGGDRVETEAAWSYATPSPSFTPIANYLAFYAGRMDACYVDGEQVTPQPGGFYGGWITSRASRARSRARPAREVGEEDDGDHRRPPPTSGSTPSSTGSTRGTASASRTTTTRRTRTTDCCSCTTTTSSRPGPGSARTRTVTWRSSRGCSTARSSTATARAITA